MSSTYKILLYYKYVPLHNPHAIRDWQYQLCQQLNIKGRIIISDEGINGTTAGLIADIDEYIKATETLIKFQDIEWKTSYADQQVFPKLSVKVRPEIVTLGQKKQSQDVALENKAHYIEPEELAQLYDRGEDFVILDARNLYEAKVGKFKDALIPPIDNFREFPQFVNQHLEKYKDKQIVTYCTGGIRCEKASAYLREKGYTNVRQLHGGVHHYAQVTGGKHFQGELFVFDQRLHVPVNKVDPQTIAECHYCRIPITRNINCAYPRCNLLFNCCSDCEKKHQSYCSSACHSKNQSSPITSA